MRCTITQKSQLNRNVIGRRGVVVVEFSRRPSADANANDKTEDREAMRLILLIIVILLLVGALPTWPYSAAWGYYPSGGLGLIVIILIIVLLVG